MSLASDEPASFSAREDELQHGHCQGMLSVQGAADSLPPPWTSFELSLKDLYAALPLVLVLPCTSTRSRIPPCFTFIQVRLIAWALKHPLVRYLSANADADNYKPDAGHNSELGLADR